MVIKEQQKQRTDLKQNWKTLSAQTKCMLSMPFVFVWDGLFESFVFSAPQCTLYKKKVANAKCLW